MVGILAAVMAAVRSTYSTTTQATLMQLVFGRNAIINTKFIADWDYIRHHKQNIIHNNNERANAKRIPHKYQIGDKIMLKKYNQHKYGGPEYKGPYAITTVNDNGTVHIQRHKFYDIVNIRNIKPYYQ